MKKLILAIMLSSVVFAQESNKEVKVPEYTEDDRLMLRAALALSQQADKACNDLEQMKNFKAYYADVKTSIEKKYKGYQLDGVNLVPIKAK